MKKHLTSGLLVSTCIALTGCFLFDSASETIMGRYKVAWIDVKEQQIICEQSEEHSTMCIDLVSEYVFAVGHDDNYIIAKQHPTSGFDNGFKIDTTVTNYFIIDTKRKVIKKGSNVIGPLTKEQFDSKRRELKIETIKFDMNYPDVP